MPAAEKNTHRLMIVLSLIALVTHASLLSYVCHMRWAAAMNDAGISTVLLALSMWAIVLVVKAYPTSVAIILHSLVAATFFSLVLGITELQLLKWLQGKDGGYYDTLVRTLPVRMLLIWLVNGWVATYIALKKKNDSLETKFQLQADAGGMLREAELFKLRQQLQPHFLYNSLNSINALIMIQPDRAQEMVGRLSDFLRSSVRREAQEKIPIDEELLYIQSYLAIESIRFGDRLNVVFNKQYTDDATVPPFLVQPILENAIKFGLYGKTGAVTITMHIALVDSILTITVTNPYDPDGQPPKGTGFGLEGIKRRLYLLYARGDLLDTKSEEGIFTTILKIPQSYVQGNTN